MNPVLNTECQAVARALPRLIFFTIVTAIAYFALVVTELGYGTEQLRLASTIIALVSASLIVNTVVCLFDVVRYAERYREENATRQWFQ